MLFLSAMGGQEEQKKKGKTYISTRSTLIPQASVASSSESFRRLRGRTTEEKKRVGVCGVGRSFFFGFSVFKGLKKEKLKQIYHFNKFFVSVQNLARLMMVIRRCVRALSCDNGI